MATVNNSSSNNNNNTKTTTLHENLKNNDKQGRQQWRTMTALGRMHFWEKYVVWNWLVCFGAQLFVTG